MTKIAFVLMPFSSHFDENYTSVFKPALQELGYNVNRADDIYIPGTLVLQILNSILVADLILCEMSDRNPNVFYELGLAHANDRPVILVSDNKESVLPFDLSHMRTILYDRNDNEWKNRLKGAIQLAAHAVETSERDWKPFPPDMKNPLVEDFRISSPHSGDVKSGRFAVTGTFERKPTDETVMLFVVSLDNAEYWPQDPVHINLETKTWHGEVALYEKPLRGAYIVVARVGDAGRTLCEYYMRVGEQTELWIPLRNVSKDIREYDRIRIMKPAEKSR